MNELCNFMHQALQTFLIRSGHYDDHYSGHSHELKLDPCNNITFIKAITISPDAPIDPDCMQLPTAASQFVF